MFWAYFQAGKIGATLLFAPDLWWIVLASQSRPWTYFCSPNLLGEYSHFCNAWILSPYGLLWYGFYGLLSLNPLVNLVVAYKQMMIFLCIIDSLVFYTILRYGRNGTLSWLYYFSSFFFLYWAPSDLLPFWLGALALFKWPNSILSVFSKLPLGAPAYVWGYVLNLSLSTTNLGYYFNELRYPLLGLWMISPVVRKLALRIVRK